MNTAHKFGAYQGNVGKNAGAEGGVKGQEGSVVVAHHLPSIYRDEGQGKNDGRGQGGGGNSGGEAAANNEQLVALLAGAHTGQLKTVAKDLVRPKPGRPGGQAARYNNHESLESWAVRDGSRRNHAFDVSRKQYSHGAVFGSDPASRPVVVAGKPFDGRGPTNGTTTHWADATLTTVASNSGNGDVVSRAQRNIRGLPPSEQEKAREALNVIAQHRPRRGRQNNTVNPYSVAA